MAAVNVRRVTQLTTLLLFISCQLPNGCRLSRLSPSQDSHIEAVLRHHKRIVLDEIDDGALLKAPSASVVAPVHLNVEAFGRVFELSLRQGNSIYTPDAQIVIHEEDSVTKLSATEYGTDSVEGYLLSDPASTYIHGHVIDGVFDGLIATPQENYYIEPASKFFDNVGELDAIIYRESDVKRCSHDGLGTSASELASLCPSGLKNAIELEQLPSPTTNGLVQTVSEMLSNWTSSTYESESPTAEAAEGKARQVCRMKAVADHTLYQTLGNRNVRKTISHMEFHIREADRIYRQTDFDFDGKPDNIRLRISKVEVYKSKDDKGYLMGDENLSSEELLQQFSTYDHDGLCAAMLFVNRIVPPNVLGYAYRGGEKISGGICFPRQLKGEDRETSRSYNVGFVSNVWHDGQLALAQSTIVVAHELGHMFGSKHDETQDGGACFHEEEKKHYVMSSFANPGKSKMNRQFSECSRRAIRENLKFHGDCLVCKGRECGSAGSTFKKTSPLIYFLVSQLFLFVMVTLIVS